MYREVLARGYGEFSNTGTYTIELIDWGEAGWQYTPMGHCPNANDRRYRYVAFINGRTSTVLTDDLECAVEMFKRFCTRGTAQLFGKLANNN